MEPNKTERTGFLRYPMGYMLKALLLPVCLALGLRVLAIIVLESSAPSFFAFSHIDSLALRLRYVAEGKLVYWGDYPPLALLFYSGLFSLTTDRLLLRLPSIFCDLLNGLILYSIASIFYEKKVSRLVSILYLFNPISVLLAVHGEFDAIPVLFVLLAVYYILSRRSLLSYFSLTLGFLFKWFPILLLPLLLKRASIQKRKGELLILTVLPFFLLIVSYLPMIAFWGLTWTSIYEVSVFQYGVTKTPGSLSIYSLVYCVFPTLTPEETIVLSYLVQPLIFAALSLALRADDDLRFLKSSFILLITVVNLSVEVEANYTMWFYPFLLLILFTPDGFKRKAFLSAIAYASVILFYLDWYGYFGFTGTWEGIPIFERMIDLYTRFWHGGLRSPLELVFLLSYQLSCLLFVLSLRQFSGTSLPQSTHLVNFFPSIDYMYVRKEFS